MKIKNNELVSYLNELFPNARCELVHKNVFELLIAVMLSAQTTDVSVNKVTPKLFEQYPTCYDLAKADYSKVCEIIKPIGIYKNKANSIIETSKELVEKYNGIVPYTIEELTTLKGVGRKTASVVLIEGFNIPAFPVDTHIKRIANRLGLSNSDDANVVEQDLRKFFDENLWIKLHHQIIFFGRYFCTARNPKCSECKIQKYCKYYSKNCSTIDK